MLESFSLIDEKKRLNPYVFAEMRIFNDVLPRFQVQRNKEKNNRRKKKKKGSSLVLPSCKSWFQYCT